MANDPKHTRPGVVASHLALDAVLPLYPLLRAPGDDATVVHRFLKEAVDYAQLAPHTTPALWDNIRAYAEATLPPETAEQWLAWVFNAFTGTHPPDVDLSGWLMAIDHFSTPHADWHPDDVPPEHVPKVRAFLDAYQDALDTAGFRAAVAEAQAQPLSDWDKRMHQAYGFVYFDQAAGADPFLLLSFMHQGETLRHVLTVYDFPPDFPHDGFQAAAQRLIDRRHVWMPEGKRLSPLRAVT